MRRAPSRLAMVLLLSGTAAHAAQSAPQQTPPPQSYPQSSQSHASPSEAAPLNAQLALEYLRRGDLESARDKIEKALAQDPHKADTQMAAGLVFERLGDQRKARSHYEEAARLGKDDPRILNTVGVFYCRNGERKRGEEYFVRAAGSPLYRTPEVAYTNAGQCAEDDGRPKEAEQYFRKALAARPDFTEPLLHLAELEHRSGNDLSARAFLQRYLSLGPATPSILMLGVQIERGMGDAIQAEAYARRLRNEFPNSEEAAKLLDEERAKP